MSSMMVRRLSDVPVGERVLVGHSRNEYRSSRTTKVPVLSLRTVVDASDVEAVRVATPTGEIEIVDRHGVIVGSPRREHVMWTNSLPNGTDDQILAFAKAVGTAALASTYMHALILHVEAVEDGQVTARPVYPSLLIEHEDRLLDEEGGRSSRPELVVLGNAAFHEQTVELAADTTWSTPDEESAFGLAVTEAPALAVGDLIIAADFDFRLKDGGYEASLLNAAVIGNFRALADVGTFLPASLSPSCDRALRWPFMRIAAAERIENGMSRAHAKAEPDEALFLWYPETTGSRPETACAVIGHTGIIFHETDSPADYFWNEGIEPGLWVLEKASFWSTNYEGEHDCGIEGDWRPATIKDIERFGFDLTGLDQEIADYLEPDDRKAHEFVGGLARSYLAMAESAARAEQEKIAQVSAP